MPDDILVFVAIGFCAQLVDGALGMAFGVLTTTSLLTMGLPPAAASAMTHVTEVFTTAASGASHAYRRNVDWRLVARLAPRTDEHTYELQSLMHNSYAVFRLKK